MKGGKAHDKSGMDYSMKKKGKQPTKSSPPASYGKGMNVKGSKAKTWG